MLHHPDYFYNPGSPGIGSGIPYGNFLDGFTIVDLSQIFAGSAAAHQLSLLGADRLKFENAAGPDGARQYGPTYFPSLNSSADYLVAVNLKDPAGRKLLYGALARADAIIYNGLSSTADKLGYGREKLAKLFPHLVQVQIVGDFYKPNKPSYDNIALAEGGTYGPMGEYKAPGATESTFHAPTISLADYCGGMFGAQAVISGLLRRERTGDVGFVRVGLKQAAQTAFTQAFAAASHEIIAPRNPATLAASKDHGNIFPFGPFLTGGGFDAKGQEIPRGEIIVCVGNDKGWREFAARIGLDDETTIRFASNDARMQHRVQLRTIIEGKLSTRTAEAWLREFNKKPKAAAAIPKTMMEVIASHRRKKNLRDHAIPVVDAEGKPVFWLPMYPIYSGAITPPIRHSGEPGRDNERLAREIAAGTFNPRFQPRRAATVSGFMPN